MSTEIEKLNDFVAEQVAKATDDGFIRGIEWLGDFVILELQYQGLEEVSQKMKLFVNRKKEEFKKLK